MNKFVLLLLPLFLNIAFSQTDIEEWFQMYKEYFSSLAIALILSIILVSGFKKTDIVNDNQAGIFFVIFCVAIFIFIKFTRFYVYFEAFFVYILFSGAIGFFIAARKIVESNKTLTLIYTLISFFMLFWFISIFNDFFGPFTYPIYFIIVVMMIIFLVKSAAELDIFEKAKKESATVVTPGHTSSSGGSSSSSSVTTGPAGSPTPSLDEIAKKLAEELIKKIGGGSP